MKRSRAEPWEESDAEEESDGSEEASDGSDLEQGNNAATLSRLRAALRAKDVQIKKLVEENKNLNLQLCAAPAGGAARSEPEPSAEELAAAAEKWRR